MPITFFEYKDGKPVAKDPEWVGRVLRTREENGYHDSYFYATVWDDEKMEAKEIQYGSTAYASGCACVIDADYQTLVRATGALAADLLEEWERKRCTEISLGDKVCITGGPHAGETVYYIRWSQERRSRYGTWSYGMRYGLGKTPDQRGKYVFVSDEHVEKLVEPLSAQEIQDNDRHAWATAYRHYGEAWRKHENECDLNPV